MIAYSSRFSASPFCKITQLD